MKRTIIAACLAAAAALPILLSATISQAETPEAGSTIDASKMPESGPAASGGTGQTVGPNSKNQAVMPMPGLREEELSERPPPAMTSTPEVRPVPGKPVKQR